MTTTERRKRVMRAVVAIEAMPVMHRNGIPVRSAHIRGWGIPECLPSVTLATIDRDLCWLEGEGYVLRPKTGPEYVSTEAGQRWAR